MATHQSAQIRRLIHAIREPFGSLSIYLGMLEREKQTASARAYVRAMRASVKRAVDVFEEIDFWLDNGYPRPVASPDSPQTASERGFLMHQLESLDDPGARPSHD
jgi:hypothetical protein